MLSGFTPWPEALVERYRCEGLWRGESLGHLADALATAYGSRTAIVHGDTRLSYVDLATRVDRMAAGFQRHGLRPGDRVVLQLPNVPEFIVVAFALFRLGVKP